jgi:hypothetical protein
MRKLAFAALAAAALVASPAAGAQQEKKKKVLLPPDSMYALQAKTLEGQPMNLADFAGQVALVVNLASR